MVKKINVEHIIQFPDFIHVHFPTNFSYLLDFFFACKTTHCCIHRYSTKLSSVSYSSLHMFPFSLFYILELFDEGCSELAMTVSCLALLLHIWEVPCSILGPLTGSNCWASSLKYTMTTSYDFPTSL